jgi:hypothetical protein
VAATLQTVGATTGHTQTTETAAEVVSTVTTVLGMGTLIKTGGNLNKAASAAAIEGVVTSNPKDLASGGTIARAAKAIEFERNLDRAWQAVKSWF